jgi:hypothetical protein
MKKKSIKKFKIVLFHLHIPNAERASLLGLNSNDAINI